jgi:hypothetical protein
VKAWGNPQATMAVARGALKARNNEIAIGRWRVDLKNYFAPTALAVFRHQIPGALPQAFTFRAFGAFNIRNEIKTLPHFDKIEVRQLAYVCLSSQ